MQLADPFWTTGGEVASLTTSALSRVSKQAKALCLIFMKTSMTASWTSLNTCTPRKVSASNSKLKGALNSLILPKTTALVLVPVAGAQTATVTKTTVVAKVTKETVVATEVVAEVAVATMVVVEVAVPPEAAVEDMETATTNNPDSSTRIEKRTSVAGELVAAPVAKATTMVATVKNLITRNSRSNILATEDSVVDSLTASVVANLKASVAATIVSPQASSVMAVNSSQCTSRRATTTTRLLRAVRLALSSLQTCHLTTTKSKCLTSSRISA